MPCEPIDESTLTPKLLGLAVQAVADRTLNRKRTFTGSPKPPVVAVHTLDTMTALGLTVDIEDCGNPAANIASRGIEIAVNGHVTLYVVDNEFMFRCFGSEQRAISESLTLTIPPLTYVARFHDTYPHAVPGLINQNISRTPETKFVLHVPMTPNVVVPKPESLTTLLGMTKKLERTLYLLQLQINSVYFQQLFLAEKCCYGR